MIIIYLYLRHWSTKQSKLFQFNEIFFFPSFLSFIFCFNNKKTEMKAFFSSWQERKNLWWEWKQQQKIYEKVQQNNFTFIECESILRDLSLNGCMQVKINSSSWHFYRTLSNYGTNALRIAPHNLAIAE